VSDAVEGKCGLQVDQTQGIKDIEGTGDLGGLYAKSGHCSCRSRLFGPEKKVFLPMLASGWKFVAYASCLISGSIAFDIGSLFMARNLAFKAGIRF